LKQALHERSAGRLDRYAKPLRVTARSRHEPRHCFRNPIPAVPKRALHAAVRAIAENARLEPLLSLVKPYIHDRLIFIRHRSLASSRLRRTVTPVLAL
jgi:hypothetical protein